MNSVNESTEECNHEANTCPQSQNNKSSDLHKMSNFTY